MHKMRRKLLIGLCLLLLLAWAGPVAAQTDDPARELAVDLAADHPEIAEHLHDLEWEAGAATDFYPAFAFPLWAGWFRGQNHRTFVVAFALVATLCLATVFIGHSLPDIEEQKPIW